MSGWAACDRSSGVPRADACAPVCMFAFASCSFHIWVLWSLLFVHFLF